MTASEGKVIIKIFIFSVLYCSSLRGSFKTSSQFVKSEIIKSDDNYNELRELIDLGRGYGDDSILRQSKTPFSVLNSDSKNNDRGTFSMPFVVPEIEVTSNFEQEGTHLDSPYQFSESSWKIDQIPLDNLLAPGFLLDMMNETEKNSEFLLQPKHLRSWENRFGEIPKNSILLINFGWASRWQDKHSYLGLKESGNGDTFCHFPGISEEAAHWIVQSKKVVGVGVDTASVDTGRSTNFKVHEILASANIYNIENINFDIDRKLPARGFDLIVMPMKIKDGSAAPCRLIAKPATTETIIKRRKCNTKRGASKENSGEESNYNSTSRANLNTSCFNNLFPNLILIVALIK